MKDVQVHQLVHGYRRGHELLASSLTLSGGDKDAVGQLSDLSGMPTRSPIPPYLTAYPLPSRSHYALARTWLDVDAPREGCVITHTLLIPMQAWASALAVQPFFNQLTRPARSSLGRFSIPLPFTISTLDAGNYLPSTRDMSEDRLRLIKSYFIEGRKPIVWFDAKKPDEFLVWLIDAVWPALRAEFAACTFSLKMRAVGGRTFDLLFAPSDAVGRFGGLVASQLIGYGRSDDVGGRERLEALTDILLSNPSSRQNEATSRGSWLDWHEVVRSLPADPTAITKVMLLDELRERSTFNAASAVAALDVLAALSPEPEHAINLKRFLLERAVQRATLEPVRQAVELLGAIAQRCVKPSFSSLRFLRRSIVRDIARLAAAAPEKCAAALLTSKVRRGALVGGVARGLLEAGKSGTLVLPKLESERPDIVDSVLSYSPGLVRYYVDASSETMDEAARANVASRWLHRALKRDRLRLAAQLAESDVVFRHDQLLRAVFEQLDEKGTRALIKRGLAEIVDDEAWATLEQAAYNCPDAVQSRVDQYGIHSERIASLWARTLPQSPSILNELLHARSSDPCYQALALATYVQRSDLRNDIRSIIERQSSRLISGLLKSNYVSGSQSVRAAIQILSKECSFEELAQLLQPTDDLQDSLDSLDAEPRHRIRSGLVVAVSSIYIKGVITFEDLTNWLATSYIKASFAYIDVEEIAAFLASVTSDQTRNREDICALTQRAWKWLHFVGAAVSANSPSKLPRLIDGLFVACLEVWSEDLTTVWVNILDAARIHKSRNEMAQLDAQAVQAALSHPHRQLSKLLMSSFPSVYQTVISGRPSLMDIMFGYADWDKGKDLRRSLVKAFVSSDWPPRHLAITASRAGIIDKVASRLNRTGCSYYLDQMIADLSITDDYDIGVARNIRDNRKRIEDWD